MRAEILAERRQRCHRANAFIASIAACGRHFFESKDGDYARLEVDDRGRVWFICEWRGTRIYTHRQGRWRWFHHGGTLKDLIERLRDFITKDKQLPPTLFGPWPAWIAGGDLWGYKDDMVKVREAGALLGITKEVS